MSCPVKAKGLTAKQCLVKILSENRFLTLHEIQREMIVKFGVFSSETSISARWRELGDVQKECRVRKGSHAWEYRLVA